MAVSIRVSMSQRLQHLISDRAGCTRVLIEYPGCWQHLRGDVIACSCTVSGDRASFLSQRSIAPFASSLLVEMRPHIWSTSRGWHHTERGAHLGLRQAHVRRFVPRYTAKALPSFFVARPHRTRMVCSGSARIESRTTCTTAVGG